MRVTTHNIKGVNARLPQGALAEDRFTEKPTGDERNQARRLIQLRLSPTGTDGDWRRGHDPYKNGASGPTRIGEWRNIGGAAFLQRDHEPELIVEAMQYEHTNSHSSRPDERLIAEFEAFISDARFPCVGAKSALNRERMTIVVCDELGSDTSANVLCEQLAAFSSRHPNPGNDPVSFAAIFRSSVADEDDFHDCLWQQLQRVHELDARTYPWAPSVSSDAAANDFSFSVASRAFFVVGLHPHSSRHARRATRPTLVFNFHDQFESMRTSGRYAKLQAAIRVRDVALQGQINPVLAQFGDASEARQYSGKNGGVCPFHANKASA